MPGPISSAGINPKITLTFRKVNLRKFYSVPTKDKLRTGDILAWFCSPPFNIMMSSLSVLTVSVAKV